MIHTMKDETRVPGIIHQPETTVEKIRKVLLKVTWKSVM